MQRLAERAGPSRAREIVYTTDQYDAATFERWNIVNRVVPDEVICSADAGIRRTTGDGPRSRMPLARDRARLPGKRRPRGGQGRRPRGPALFESEDMRAGVAGLLEHGPRGFRDKVVFRGR